MKNYALFLLLSFLGLTFCVAAQTGPKSSYSHNAIHQQSKSSLSARSSYWFRNLPEGKKIAVKAAACGLMGVVGGTAVHLGWPHILSLSGIIKIATLASLAYVTAYGVVAASMFGAFFIAWLCTQRNNHTIPKSSHTHKS